MPTASPQWRGGIVAPILAAVPRCPMSGPTTASTFAYGRVLLQLGLRRRSRARSAYEPAVLQAQRPYKGPVDGTAQAAARRSDGSTREYPDAIPTSHSGRRPASAGRHRARSLPPSCRAGPGGCRRARPPEARISVRPPPPPSPCPNDETDVRHRATLSTDRRADVLGPSPTGLVRCSTNGETADAYDFELSLLHDSCVVGTLEPPKDHLDPGCAHRPRRSSATSHSRIPFATN
jgi:hypothetical protein